MSLAKGIEAGKISRPFGVRGEVVLILDAAQAGYIKNKDPLFVEIDRQRVPFFLEEFELGSDGQAIARLEFVSSLEEARKICGCRVFLEEGKQRQNDGGPDDPARFIGYLATDLVQGDLGTIGDYLHADMNPVWLIDFHGRELMVPAVEAFISSVDHKQQRITFSLPEGLTSL
ncbi:MAG: hypothetical protein CSA96_02105 [Bacteroidetes bacterium]|nr:MAG: hypothetical protein CSA96_02105 [Bacteroidota bacterium]